MGNGDCVEVDADGSAVLLRNSKHPQRTTLVLPATAVAGFVAACAAGELDDITD